MTSPLLKRRMFRPAPSREESTLRAIEESWPSGEWVDPTDPESENVGADPSGPDEAGASDPEASPKFIAIIGGTQYDPEEVERFVTNLDPHDDIVIVTGGARGVEKYVLELAEELGIPTLKITPDPDMFGKNAAKVNVEQVLSYSLTDPVLVVGDGTRAKQAHAWLKRANWTRAVISLET